MAGGIEGYYLLNDRGESSFHWSRYGVRFQLLGQIDRETAIELAESTKAINQ